MYIKRGLVPDYIRLLILEPVTAVSSQTHVEVVYDFGENQTHLGISKTISVVDK